MKELSFNEDLEKIQKSLRDTAEVQLKSKYDAILIKTLASTDLLSKDTASSSQSYIAISGKKSQDFFPYVNILHYTDSELNPGFKSSKFKSFFTLQVPVFINELNVSHVNKSSGIHFDEKGTVLTKVSVKISRPANPQIEFANTTTSKENFKLFRKLFAEGDVLVLLKCQGELIYEAYIIKKDVAKEFDITDVVLFKPKKLTSTSVELDEVQKIDTKDLQQQFASWWFAQPSRSGKNPTAIRTKYLRGLNFFINEINKVQPPIVDVPIVLWNDPKQTVTEVNKESLRELAKLVPNLPPSYVSNDSGGLEWEAAWNSYVTWANVTDFNLIIEDEKYVDTFNDILKKEFRQYIYFGAPGTGKSYQLAIDSQWFEGKVERVTFHPNMSYGQFVGAFKPFPTKIPVREINGKPVLEEKITYKFIPGALIKQLVQALLHPNSAYLLIVEELNRANVAAVFGEMFQLLDRKSDFSSEYPIAISEDMQLFFESVYAEEKNKPYAENMKRTLKDGLVFPSNFFIWTTMNSADQGVMPMDTAFKRRWEQKYFGIDDAWNTNEGKARFAGYSKINLPKGETISWNVMRRLINDILSDYNNIPEDKMLGPYFISENILRSDNEAVTKSFESKVLMYLFDDVAKIRPDRIFHGVEKMRYSEVVKKFRDDGLALFNISNEEVAEKEKEEEQ
ncbi:AAA family ATPase [Bacillus cereus]|nr:AAA family ATPase [Bacillus cereus]